MSPGKTSALIVCQEHCVHNQFAEIRPLNVQLLPFFFIDLVSKAYSVDHSEFEAHVALLEFVGVGLERDSRLVVLSGLALKLGVEQRVHQGGLPQTCLTYKDRKHIMLTESNKS